MLVEHGVERVVQQIDQYLLKADGIADHPGRTRQVQRNLDGLSADAHFKQMQRLVDDHGQVEPLT
ncbi:hypothetical protein D3C81_1876050 [compost metagenome]